MKKNGHTDKSFGLLIDRKRLTVWRYRHGQQMPRADIGRKIETVTGGEVTFADICLACVRYQADLLVEAAA